MPHLLPNGTAVDYSTDPDAQYVSWDQLARESGNPSLAHEAQRGTKAWYREQAQEAILRAYNRKASA